MCRFSTHHQVGGIADKRGNCPLAGAKWRYEDAPILSFRGKPMRRFISAALLQFLFLSVLNPPTFAQASYGQVGGTVQDASKALVPGVTLTLTNTATGVVTTQITNESGVYNFSSVPAGIYSVTASLPGFKTSVTNDVEANLAPVRVNITLEIETLDSKIEVRTAPDVLLTENAASVGTLLSQQMVTDLPLVGQNVLSLLDVLPGFRISRPSVVCTASLMFNTCDDYANDYASTINGLSLDYTNTTVNGLSTVSTRDAASRWGRQVLTTNVINPDLVGAVRLIESPIDAELGGGNSQIQIQTRSGTNKYGGAVVWNVQNTALNANTWANKRNPGPPTQPDWYNLNDITGSYGGPIVRNKAFFFVLFNKQFVNRRTLFQTQVLTDTARQGIWRYWEGWNPGPALLPDPTFFIVPGAQPTGTAASVDFNGNPIAPNFNPTGGAYTLGGLRCFSVFGNVKVDGSPFTQADCPGGTAVINAGPWDPLRTTVDSTGYIRKILAMMPHANYFARAGDGLNTALFRWLQGRKGPHLFGTNYAIHGVVDSKRDYNNRDQINIRIDHNISTKHRISTSWTYERDSGDAGIAPWGTGLNGDAARRPQFVTVSGTSVLSPSLVNEARFGLNYSAQFGSSPWANFSHQDIRDAAQKFILYGGTNATNGKKYPVLYDPGTPWNGFMAYSLDQASYSPLYNFADAIRWTYRKHYFSFGGEYRRPSTVGYNDNSYIHVTTDNAGGTSTPLFFTRDNPTNGPALCGATTTPCQFLAATRNNAGYLLSTLFGAIGGPISTAYWIDGQSDLKNGKWQDVTTAEKRLKSADVYGHPTLSQVSNEWSFFAKDDYKLSRRLTLNIGIRYDFTGSPYLRRGLTNAVDGGSFGLYGAGRAASGDPFSTWLTPGDLYLTGYGRNATNPLQCAKGVPNPNGLPTSSCDPNLMSTFIFIGPGTDHPDLTLVPQKGQFSPAIGFAWQLPWFGEGKTTVRGGFQRKYGKSGAAFDDGLPRGPAADGRASGVNTNDPRLQTIFASRALNLTDLALVVPATPSRSPQEYVYPVGARSFVLFYYPVFDPNFRTPYVDNWTLAITRGLTRSLTLEVRTVNTLARDQPSTRDLNTVNVYHNPELFHALEVTRAGGDDPLFDQMLMGLNLNVGVPGYGPVGTCVTQPAGSTDPRRGQNCTGGNDVLQRGSAALRRAYATSLANGNYAAVVTNLLSANPTGLEPVPFDPATGAPLFTSQRVLRNGCDRIADGVNLTGFTANGVQILPRCFPENYFITNPQWDSAMYTKNLGYSNYNSLEVQLTMRPTHGLSFQSTYGFSKTMVEQGTGCAPGCRFTDPLNPAMDYGLSARGSDFRTNGTFELPIGPNQLLLGKSSGWLARVLERWQMGFIYNIFSGSPRTFFTGNNMLYANGRPNIVGPWTNPKGSVSWNGQNGSFFKDSYATYSDPQCQSVTTLDNLRASCSLQGLARVVPQSTPGAIPLSDNSYGIPLLENPTPGHQGNLGANTLKTFPMWRLDANLSKTFRISESKSVQLRIDATNFLNHPTPTDPMGLTNGGSSFSDNFGQITSKTGSRTFQAMVRISF